MIKVFKVKEKPKLGERNHLCKFYSRHQFLLLFPSPSLLPKKNTFSSPSLSSQVQPVDLHAYINTYSNNNKHYEIYFYFPSINARMGRGRLGTLVDDTIPKWCLSTSTRPTYSVQIEWILIMRSVTWYITLGDGLISPRWAITHQSSDSAFSPPYPHRSRQEHSGRLFFKSATWERNSRVLTKINNLFPPFSPPITTL